MDRSDLIVRHDSDINTIASLVSSIQQQQFGDTISNNAPESTDITIANMSANDNTNQPSLVGGHAEYVKGVVEVRLPIQSTSMHLLLLSYHPKPIGTTY